MRIVELTEEQFDDFSIHHDNHNYYQTSSYAKVMRMYKFKTVYLGLADNYNNIIAATLVLHKNIFRQFKCGYCPRGFLIDYYNKDLLQVFTTKLKNYLKYDSFLYIRIDPSIVRGELNQTYNSFNSIPNSEYVIKNLISLEYKPIGFNKSMELIQPKYDIVTKLGNSIDELFSSFSKETKEKIKLAENNQIEIVRGSVDDIDEFYKLLPKEERKKIEYYLNYYHYFKKNPCFEIYFAKLNSGRFVELAKKMYEEEEEKNEQLTNLILNLPKPINPELMIQKQESDAKLNEYNKKIAETSKIFRDYPDNFYLATCAIIKCNKEIYVLAEGTNEKYKDYYAKYLLKWDLMKEATLLGYNKFNHGGISSEFYKESMEYKKFNYKNGYNGIAQEYIGEFNLIISPIKYMTYKSFNPLLKSSFNITSL